MVDAPIRKTARWPVEALQVVLVYVQDHPIFYIEAHIRLAFPSLETTSMSIICRVLNFDLNLSRKVLTKAAREAAPEEIKNYKNITSYFSSCMMLIDLKNQRVQEN